MATIPLFHLVEALKWVFSALAIPGINTLEYGTRKYLSGLLYGLPTEKSHLSSGVLKIIDPGILALVDGTGNTIWAANVTRSTQDTVAQLMDSGNLVVKDANDDNPEHFLWQSFDYPGDTFLPGMKLGKNFVTGLELKLSSWKSRDDPAKGEFTYWCDPRGYPQFFLNNSSVKFYRTGPWNGIGFSTTRVWHNSAYTLELVVTMDEVHYSYETLTSSIFSRFVLSHVGNVRRLAWRDETQEWARFLVFPTENCDTYNLCGVNGICNVGNSPACSCLSKFVPQNQTEWGNGDWSNGCVRRTPLDCHNGDKFLKYSGNKLPDTRYSWFNKITTLRECEKLCLNNCSCTAYTNLDIRQGGSGCLLWFDELIDMRQYSEDGQDIYIRMASSELGKNSFQTPSSSGFTKHTIPVASLVLITSLIIMLCNLHQKYQTCPSPIKHAY